MKDQIKSPAGFFPSGPPGDGGMEGAIVQPRAVRPGKDQQSVVPIAIESPPGLDVGTAFPTTPTPASERVVKGFNLLRNPGPRTSPPKVTDSAKHRN